MREDDLLEIVDRHLGLDHHRGAVYQLSRIVGDQMNTYDSVVLLVNDHLADAVSAFVFGEITSAVRHGKLLDLNVVALGFCGSLGLADGADLGVSVNDGRDGVVSHSVLLAEDVVDGDLAFTVGGMSKHDLAVYIACGVEAGYACLHIFVGDYRAAFHNGVEGLATVALRDSAAADGAKHLVGGGDFDLTVGRLELNAFGEDCRYLAAEVELNALGFVVAEEYLGYFRVRGSGDVVEHLDDGDLGADGVVV